MKYCSYLIDYTYLLAERNNSLQVFRYQHRLRKATMDAKIHVSLKPNREPDKRME